jgi:hypothetical protein
VYKPLDSGVAYEYTMDATSASGFYKFGSLQEKNLLNLYGHRVAILVVDSCFPAIESPGLNGTIVRCCWTLIQRRITSV